jgi:hypothetical protein
MRVTIKFAIAAAMAGALAACGPTGSAPEAAKAGADKPGAATEIGDNTYQNKALGLTVTAPEGWYVAPSDVMEKLMTAGTELTTTNMNKTTKAAVQNSMQRTASIFTFTEQPPGAAVEYIAAVMGVTEDISMMPGIQRGSDYFFHARKVFEQSAVPTTIADDYKTRRIGGQEFDRMDVEMGPPGATVKQRYFAARHGGMVFALIQSYRTDEELATLDKVLDSIKLDW